MVELYLEIKGGGAAGIYVSKRDDLSSPFGAPEPVFDDPEFSEGNATLTVDSRLIVFSANGVGNGDLFYATRDSPAAPWSAPAPIPDLNTANRESEPGVSPDGCELFYLSGEYEMLVSTFIPP